MVDHFEEAAVYDNFKVPEFFSPPGRVQDLEKSGNLMQLSKMSSLLINPKFEKSLPASGQNINSASTKNNNNPGLEVQKLRSPTVRVQQKQLISPAASKRRNTKVESEYNYTNLIDGSLLE